MENIKIEIGADKIQEAFNLAAAEVFESSYSNPVKDLLTKAINEQEGAIKKIVDEIIVEAISKAEFKTKIADAVIKNMVDAAIRKN